MTRVLDHKIGEGGSRDSAGTLVFLSMAVASIYMISMVILASGKHGGKQGPKQSTAPPNHNDASNGDFSGASAYIFAVVDGGGGGYNPGADGYSGAENNGGAHTSGGNDGGHSGVGHSGEYAEHGGEGYSGGGGGGNGGYSGRGGGGGGGGEGDCYGKCHR